MKPVTVLKKARELLSGRGKWAQGWMAFNKTGAGVSAKSPDAVCFCSLGAIDRITDGDVDSYTGAIDLLHSQLPNDVSIPGFNDNPKRTKKQILRLFDKAIEGSK
jgi:hypothetical protein